MSGLQTLIYCKLGVTLLIEVAGPRTEYLFWISNKLDINIATSWGDNLIRFGAMGP